MYKSRKIKSSYKIFSVFVLMFYLLLYTYNKYAFDIVTVDFMVNSIVFVVVVFFILINKIFYIHNLLYLFFISFSLFIFSRIFLNFFGISSILESQSFYWGMMEKSSIIQTLFVVIISFSSVLLGAFFYNIKQKNDFQRSMFLPSKGGYGKAILILFLMLLPGTLHKYYFDLQQVLNEGYLALYSRENIIVAPIFSRLSWYLYTLILPLVFCIEFNNKFKTKLLIVFILMVSLLDSIKGSRAAFLRPLLFCFWYYYTFYSNKKINLLKLIPSIFLIVFFTIGMLFKRTGQDVTLEQLGSVFELIFYQQGISFTVVAFYFQFESALLYPTYLYILTPITSLLQYVFNKDVFASGRNYEMIRQTFNIDYKLMHAVNSDLFYKGYGLGGSYMIELFALLGMVSLIVGSVLVGYYIIWFEQNVKSKTGLIILGWYFVNHIVFFSRGNYLLNFFNVFLTFFIFFIVRQFYSKTV